MDSVPAFYIVLADNKLYLWSQMSVYQQSML